MAFLFLLCAAQNGLDDDDEEEEEEEEEPFKKGFLPPPTKPTSEARVPPPPETFIKWGGGAKGVRSSGKLKRGERFLERLFQQAAPPELGIIQAGPLAISRENRQQGFDKVKSL